MCDFTECILTARELITPDLTVADYTARYQKKHDMTAPYLTVRDVILNDMMALPEMNTLELTAVTYVSASNLSMFDLVTLTRWCLT